MADFTDLLTEAQRAQHTAGEVRVQFYDHDLPHELADAVEERFDVESTAVHGGATVINFGNSVDDISAAREFAESI